MKNLEIKADKANEHLIKTLLPNEEIQNAKDNENGTPETLIETVASNHEDEVCLCDRDTDQELKATNDEAKKDK